MPAAFAAAASPSTFAPASDGRRRLMIDAKPIFLISGTASGVVAPPHATVVSSLAKFCTPGTVCLVTCCAAAWRLPNTVATMNIAMRGDACRRIGSAPVKNAPHHATKAAAPATAQVRRVSGCSPRTLFLVLRRDRDRLVDSHRHRRSGSQDRRVPIAGGDDRGTRTRAGRSTNRGALAATENGAEDR